MADKKPAFINVGGASIIMLFSVLCLTVFAVLSLVSANSQSRLAGKVADTVSAYYEADLRACEIIDEIKSGNFDHAKPQPGSVGAPLYAYSVEIDAVQCLDVVVAVSDDEAKVMTWKVRSTAPWVPEDSHESWDGSIEE